MTNNWFWHTEAPPKGSYNSDEIVHIHYGRIAVTVVGAIVCLIVLFGSWYQVPTGNVAIVTQFGKVVREGREGLNFKIPLIETAHIMTIQVQKYESPEDAATHDLQTVTTTIAVNFHLNPDKAREVYTRFGMDYVNTILVPTVSQTLKQVTATHPVDFLIQDRVTPQGEEEKLLQNQWWSPYIGVDAVNLTNFKPSDQYAAAIEQKQVAQQGVQTKLQIQAQAKVDADTAVITAQGIANSKVVAAQAEAQANDLITKSLSPELLQYQYILKLAPGVQTIFLPSGQNQQFILPLPNGPGQAASPSTP